MFTSSSPVPCVMDLPYGFDPGAQNIQQSVSLSQPDTITILKSQYESLARVAQQFENLKNSLLRGGVSPESLDVLMNTYLVPVAGDGKVVLSPNDALDHLHPAHNHHTLEGVTLSKTTTTITRVTELKNETEIKDDPSPDNSIEESELDFGRKGELTRNNEQGADQTCESTQRTVEIRNLPEHTTHLDVTNAIRGGALLEIYIRYSDHSARVSFVDASAARDFLWHGTCRGLYICNKRVDVFWSDRQFFLRPYIRQNVENGASRNLAIHNINSNVTASLIREHLDHIHNLVVVDVRFDPRNSIATISTNSVHNAMFARSCMRSRATYKGMRIDFANDGCARSYSDQKPISSSHRHQPRVANGNTAPQSGANRSHGNGRQQRRGVRVPALSNRFEMLSVDSVSDGTETEAECETESEPEDV